MAKVSKNLKKIRNDKKLTQDELAQRICVTRQTVSSWENDRTQPDIEMLKALAAELDVGIEELIYGEKRNVGLEAPAKTGKTLSVIFAVLGSLLGCSGLITVAVTLWDWESLPLAAKITVSLLPMLGADAAVLWVLTHRRKSLPWREGTAVAWIAGIAATYALINGIMNLNLGYESLLLLDSVCILPIGFILEAAVPAAAYLIMITVWFVVTLFNTGGLPQLALFALLFAGGIALIAFGSRRSRDWRHKACVWLAITSAAVNLTALCISIGNSANAVSFYVPLAILTALYAADRGGDFAYPFRYPCTVGSAAIMLILCGIGRDISNSFYWMEPCGITVEFLSAPIISACVLLSGLIFGHRSFKGNGTKTAFVACAAAAYCFCAVTSVMALALHRSLPDNAVTLIYMALTVGAGIALIVSGVRTSKLLNANLGLLTVFATVFMLIFGGDFGSLFNGISLMVLGGILLFINYRMTRAFKAKAVTEVSTDA